mmetsp:Transcript_19750/g.42948  ORF Transcript_19750/g.42948 Transcript_19750/m.42948 type:complete len:253 (-) Transcript_19750:4047-4805(-)
MQTTSQKNTASATIQSSFLPPLDLPHEVPVFRGEWDEQGVYVYQAYCDAIADWALEHQKFGGPAWKPSRMTWIKPSFAWMLYRSGYGTKPGQERVLKIKLTHDAIAHLLSQCKLTNTNKDTKMKAKKEIKGTGRVQWDPERDLYQSEGKEPRRMLRTRAIQIGLSGKLSEWYVRQIISIEEVTDLAHKVKAAHALKKADGTLSAMKKMRDNLPTERPYLPLLSKEKLQNLAMLPGASSDSVIRLGRGHATLV